MLKGVLLDIGGVVCIDDKPLPGAIEAISRLKASGLAVRLITNITRQSHGDLRMQLARMNLDITEDELFMPAVAARRYLLQHKLRAQLLIHQALEIDFHGLLTDGPEALVIGDAGDRFTYATLNHAYRTLVRGAEFIALAANRTFRDTDGALSIDAGVFVAALEYASGKKATVLGKPSQEFFRIALDSLGCMTNEAVMIGDDAEVDIAGALNVGLSAILVRTGKYENGAEDNINPPPTAVTDDLAAAVDWILAHRSPLNQA